MKMPNKLWAIAWRATYESNPANLWVIAASAERAAGKARKFLKKQGNTSVQIKGVNQDGTIDVF